MDGMPVMTLAAKRIKLDDRFRSPNSDRYSPTRMPNGTLMAEAMPTVIRVPTMALPKPLPNGGGVSVKTARLNLSSPSLSSTYSTEKSGARAMRVARTHRNVIAELKIERQEASE